MKTILVAINSQYVHTNLAVLYLKAACCENENVKILEFTVNETINRIYSGIIREKPDAVAFSCYIWNIELVLKLCEDLKKALPEIVTIAGGPEVSFEDGGLISGKKCVDYIISGEGEEKFPYLIKLLTNHLKPSDEELQWFSEFSEIKNINTLISPYEYIKKDSLKNRISYIESSRGCPFRCAYCISSVTSGVRFFSLEKVYQAIDILSQSGSAIIKFVDRTFNCNEKRALSIWNYIHKYSNKGVVFHFEIDPGLLTQKMLKCLEKMPAGLIQVEAGIQSIHQKTLSAVERPESIGKAMLKLEKLLSFGNIHVHVDLIAGLPFERYNDFGKSFNSVYNLFAHHFQLGFLKFLRGSSLKLNADSYGYSYRNYPPYEVIANRDISPQDLLRLKDIEACMDLFYNSGRFALTLKIIQHSHGNTESNPFGFYENLSFFLRQKGYLDRPVKAFDLYQIIYDYVKHDLPYLLDNITESLRFDYLSSMKNPSLPLFLQNHTEYVSKKEQNRLIRFYRNELQNVLPRLKDKSIDDIWNQIYITRFYFSKDFELLVHSRLVFDFGDLSPVTGLARSYSLKTS